MRVAARTGGTEWKEVARLDDAHLLQVFEESLIRPREPRLGFDLHGLECRGLRLLVEGGTSFDGWSLPEVEVRVP